MSSLDIRAIDEADLKKEKAPAVKTEYRVFLSEEAFDRAVERGGADTTREIGGVLVGELKKDDAGPYLLIDTTVDALHAEEKGAELTFTHDTWDHINKEMDTKHKGKKVVGWYHTHPGFSVFLSDRDQFIQKSFFNLPFQVAFVYDPKSKEHGMFTWRDNEIQRARRYWIGSREQVWDANRSKGEPTKKDVERPADEKSASAPPEPLLGEGAGGVISLIIVGLILLMIGGFIGRWMGLSAANEVVAHEQQLVLQAKQEGAHMLVTQLQSDLISVLRGTLGDDAVRKPVEQAVHDIDDIIKSMVEPTAAAGAGSAAGSAAAPAAPLDPRVANAVKVLVDLRNNLVRLANERVSSEALLEQLEEATKNTSMIREDLEHDVSMQRSGLGQLYAELATDYAKTDKARAKRLLITAAQLDPGNTSRYEAQLQTFEKGATLPHPGIPTSPSAPPASGSASGSAAAPAPAGGVQ